MGICVAVHHRPGSFSDRWLEYCSGHGIPSKVVDCYQSDIISQLTGAQALLWHWTHGSFQDLLMARHVIMGAEALGLKVFPNTPTCWHFDDKVAQKYLLEAVGAPLVPTHVFYTLEDALAWVRSTTYPKVFKLRRGAGSSNVRLVRKPGEMERLARKCFGRGFSPTPSFTSDASTRVSKVRRRGDLVGALKRAPKSLLRSFRLRAEMLPEKGYLYCQDFIAGNAYDIRVTVIGNRAFGFTRNVRPNDFRASGSGSIDYDLKRVDPECVRIAHEVARKVGTQSMAFDFLLDAGRPVIVEVSYCYMAAAVQKCVGYWDDRLNWHEGNVWPQDAIIEDLLATLA